MDTNEAYHILDADPSITDHLLKANYRWLIKFYHPDCGQEFGQGNLMKIVQAYKHLIDCRKNEK